jgi:hypothetical protein
MTNNIIEAFEKFIDEGETLIGDSFKNNEELKRESVLLFQRSLRLIRFAMQSDTQSSVIPNTIYEKEHELIQRSSSEIINIIKRINNLKGFDRKEKTTEI